MRQTLLALALLAGTAVGVRAQSVQPLWTYQGQLKDAGNFANGAYDFQFKLYAAPSGGSSLANVGTPTGPIVLNVTDGQFATELNFGAALFDGSDRWLELLVRPGGGGAYTTLPRQRLGVSPYSIYSDSTRGIRVDATGRVMMGPLNTAYRAIISSTTQGELLELNSSNPNYTILSLVNSSANGRPWALLSTGAAYGTGAGDLVFRDISAGQDRLILGADGVVNAALMNSSTLTANSMTSQSLTVNNSMTLGASFVNPHTLSRSMSITGHNSGTFPGSAGITFVNPVNSSSWSAAVDGTGKFSFFHTGGGSNIVAVPVLQITGGSDIAEPYDVVGAGEIAPKPGMVVCIDPERVGALRVSARAYDTAVAGIISGANGVNPGMTLTQSGSVADGEYPVANVGRVWCYVDADAGGAVQAGDLLTTSATPGHAMKARAGDANGAVLGKAMSSLESGRGLVLVLVGLQ